MEVTGYKIREALRSWTVAKDVAAKQFNDSVFAFPDDPKKSASFVAESFRIADMKVAQLEELQQAYNMHVIVPVGDSPPISLALAVKLVGGAGRKEKMWRSAATTTGRSRYDSEMRAERNKDTEYAVRTISVEECAKLAQQAAKSAGDLRAAIADGNSTKVTLGVGVFHRFSADLFV